MIRRFFINKSVNIFSLCKTKQFFFHTVNNISRKSQLNYSLLLCSYKLCYKFSNEGKRESEKKTIDDVNHLYSKYKWTDEFVRRMQQKIEEAEDNEITFILIEFYLLKIQENVGMYSKQYIKVLFFGIDFMFRNGMKHKSGGWLQTLEEILKRNPSLGKNQTDNYFSSPSFQTEYTHIQFNIAQLLQVYQKNDVQKWLQLFIHKYKDFDETNEVSDKQRFYAYLQLTDIYYEKNNYEQAHKICKKLFGLIEKQKTKNISKQTVTSGIFKYGLILMRLGSKEEAMRAFNKVEQIIDWNTHTNIKLVINIIQFYMKIEGFNQRASLLLQKVQKCYQSKKDSILFRIMYDDTLTNRTTIYLMLEKYQRLYKVLKKSKDNQKQNKQFAITYQVLSALCQFKLGKNHDGQISLKKALMATQSIKNPTPDFQPADNYFYVQLAEQKLKNELNSQSKQIIAKIKQKLMILMKTKDKN